MVSPPNLDDAAFARMLRDRVERHGETISSVVRSLGTRPNCGAKKLHKYCLRIAKSAGIRYPQQKLSRHQIRAAIRAVVQEGLTIRQAAEKTGVNKTSVSRYVQRKRKTIASTAGRQQYEDIVWKCPVHGWVNLRPCVACEALAQKAAPPDSQRDTSTARGTV